VSGVALPYKETLVIRGILKADETKTIVLIYKTLPPLANEADTSYYVKNATAYIECEGIKYPLEYWNNTQYVCHDLVPKAGKKYKLFVQWKNHVATAETTVPNMNDDLSDSRFEVDYSDYKAKIKVNCKADVKDKCAAIIGLKFLYGYDGGEFYDDILFSGLITFNKAYKGEVEETFSRYLYENNKLKYEYLILRKFDPSFVEYYRTMDASRMDDDIFSTSGSEIKWNIKGDGIGLFIGESEQYFEISK
jgi:hypothetical protein